MPGNTQTLIIHFITKTNFSAHGGKMFGFKKTKKNPTSSQEKKAKYQYNTDRKREQVHRSHPLVPDFSYTPVPECQRRPQQLAGAFTMTRYCLPALSAIPARLVPRLGGGGSSHTWLQARVTTAVTDTERLLIGLWFRQPCPGRHLGTGTCIQDLQQAGLNQTRILGGTEWPPWK